MLSKPGVTATVTLGMKSFHLIERILRWHTDMYDNNFRAINIVSISMVQRGKWLQFSALKIDTIDLEKTTVTSLYAGGGSHWLALS